MRMRVRRSDWSESFRSARAGGSQISHTAFCPRERERETVRTRVGIKHFGDAHLFEGRRRFLDGPGLSKDGVAPVLRDPVDVGRVEVGVVGVAVVKSGRSREQARVKLGRWWLGIFLWWCCCCWSLCGPARGWRRHGRRSRAERSERLRRSGEMSRPWLPHAERMSCSQGELHYAQKKESWLQPLRLSASSRLRLNIPSFASSRRPADCIPDGYIFNRRTNTARHAWRARGLGARTNAC